VDSVRSPYVLSACSRCDKPNAVNRDCLRSDRRKASTTTPSRPFRRIGDTRREGSGFSPQKKSEKSIDIWWRIGEAQPDTPGRRASQRSARTSTSGAFPRRRAATQPARFFFKPVHRARRSTKHHKIPSDEKPTDASLCTAHELDGVVSEKPWTATLFQ
jgi:hypothetical protein